VQGEEGGGKIVVAEYGERARVCVPMGKTIPSEKESIRRPKKREEASRFLWRGSDNPGGGKSSAFYNGRSPRIGIVTQFRKGRG